MSQQGAYFLCKLDEVPEGGAKKLVVRGNEILLVKLHGAVHAIEPLCTHHGTDLARGRLHARAKTIQCPLHEAVFDVPTGAPLRGPFGCDGGILPLLRRYKLRVEADAVLIEKRQAWGDL